MNTVRKMKLSYIMMLEKSIQYVYYYIFPSRGQRSASIGLCTSQPVSTVEDWHLTLFGIYYNLFVVFISVTLAQQHLLFKNFCLFSHSVYVCYSQRHSNMSPVCLPSF